MIIESRLTGFAFTWWNSVQQARRTSGYRPILEWWKMRRELKERFIPMNYNEVTFGKLQSLKMGLSSFDDYIDQYYLLEARARLHEIEQQRAQYRPLVPAVPAAAPAIPPVTAPLHHVPLFWVTVMDVANRVTRNVIILHLLKRSASSWMSCIKVAVDFVSPESVSKCLHLTEEFRELPQKHGLKEDKLEVKKMTLHAVREALKELSGRTK
ncbi:hypothetical protein GIB67_030031 [Kingdonia uniflora]|uniref:Retrotransposon gag domain-containing protein n=1 Tax=Kingdonia uniflora TaxID=39325 RepID=A0A7J7MY03_9MAGN|nr:hypothetical protein GIB67_030031 [Kingdonia uniflora]